MMRDSPGIKPLCQAVLFRHAVWLLAASKGALLLVTFITALLDELVVGLTWAAA
jgi:hypothetical protein